jgi:hypothetical protein
MITEEALPTYMAMLNTLDGVRDETGASPTPWAAWTRLWTAEENRHGDLMSKYIYLTGRSVLRRNACPNSSCIAFWVRCVDGQWSSMCWAWSMGCPDSFVAWRGKVVGGDARACGGL